MFANLGGTPVDMSISDVADRLGVSHVTAWRWVQQGAFPNAYRLNPMADQSQWRIPEEDVIALEEKRKERQDND